MLSIIMVSYNSKEVIDRCLASLRASRIRGPVEIIVVDNHSQDGTPAMIEENFPEVDLIVNRENKGFAAANNQGLAAAMGDFVLLLNPDTVVRPQTIQRALDFMAANPQAGLCGARLMSPEGVQQPSARRFPDAWTKCLTLSGISRRFPGSRVFNGHEYGHVNQSQDVEVDWVPGAFALCRREALGGMPLFDERFFLYYEETDLCRRLKQAGWKVYFVAGAEVVHIGGASSATTKESFDRHARQVRKYRMRSEWLYFYKNHGLMSVWATAGVEFGWHLLRLVKNLCSLSKTHIAKANDSLTLLTLLTRSLMETRFGRVSPPRPW